MATDIPKSNERDRAIEKLIEVVKEGLDHGFFEYSVCCEMVSGRRRELIITEGKKHKFHISEEDLRG